MQYLVGLLSLRVARECLNLYSNSPYGIFVVLDKAQFPNAEILPAFSEEVRRTLSLFLGKDVHLFLSLEDFARHQTTRYEELRLTQHSRLQPTTIVQRGVDRDRQRTIALTHPRCALLLDIGDVLTEKVKTEDNVEYERIDDGALNILRRLIEMAFQ